MSPSLNYAPQAVLAQQDMLAVDSVKSLETNFSHHYPCMTHQFLPQTAGFQAIDMWGLSSIRDPCAHNCIPNGCMGQMAIAEMPVGFQAIDMWGLSNIWDPCAHNCTPNGTMGPMAIAEMHPEMFMVALPVDQAMAQMATMEMPHMQLQMAPELHGVRNSLEARPCAPLSIQGNVWRLARDREGCRAVQQAFDDATCDGHRVLLASELHTHVWESLKCPNANHVVQKCISTLRPIDSQFIIDELLQAGPGSVAKAAKNCYGCRILQRLFEHCSPAQLNQIADHLLIDAVSLCCHIFAKYVMQHLLEFGTSNDINRLTDILAMHASALVADGSNDCCAVIGKALEQASGPSQACLVQELLADPELLADMACSRYGHLAAKLALQLADPPHKWVAVNRLSDQQEKLKASRYGRVLFSFMQKVMIGEQ